MKGGEKGEWVGKHQILSEFFGRWDYRWFFLFASLNFLLLPLLLLFLPPPPSPPPRFFSYSFLQWKQITCIINKVIRNPDLEESTVQWEIAEKTEANSFLRVLRQYELRSGPDSGLRFHCLSNPALTTSKKPSFSLSLSWTPHPRLCPPLKKACTWLIQPCDIVPIITQQSYFTLSKDDTHICDSSHIVLPSPSSGLPVALTVPRLASATILFCSYFSHPHVPLPSIYCQSHGVWDGDTWFLQTASPSFVGSRILW